MNPGVKSCLTTLQRVVPNRAETLPSFNMLSADIFPSHLPFCSSITLGLGLPPSPPLSLPLHHITIKTPCSDTPRRRGTRAPSVLQRRKTNVVCKIEWSKERERRGKGGRSSETVKRKVRSARDFVLLSSVAFSEFS